MSAIQFPFLYAADPTKGRPLFNGQVYVGEADLDPAITANQKQLNVVQEDGTVIPVPQPLTLSAGGVPTYNGKAVRLDVDGNYSIKILDKNGGQVYYVKNAYEGEPITTETIKSYYKYGESVLLSEAVADENVQAGDTVIISDRGNGLFEYKAGQTPLEPNIIACTGVLTLSLVRQAIDEKDNKKFNSTADFATGITQAGELSDEELLGMVGTDITAETVGFHAGSTLGGAKYIFLDEATSDAQGYLDGVSRFQVRALDCYACIPIGVVMHCEKLGLVDGSSADAQPAIQWALDTHDAVITPAGTYTLDNINDNLYGYQDKCYFNINGPQVVEQFRERVTFRGNKTKFVKATTPAAGFESGFVHVDVARNVEVSGFEFVGSNTGGAGSVNTGVILSSCIDVTVKDIHFTGDFTNTNSCFAGNYVFDSTISDCIADSVGLGFDFASIENVTITRNTFNGSDGAAGKGDRGFSCIIDTVVQSSSGKDNYTGRACARIEASVNGVANYQNASDIRVTGNTFNNFNSGIAAATGYGWTIAENHLKDNGIGAWVVAWDNPSVNFASTDAPPADITINGNNEFESDNYGILVETGAVNHGIIDGLKIHDNTFRGNPTYDIAGLQEVVGGVPYITNVSIKLNRISAPDKISNSFDSAMIRESYVYGYPSIDVTQNTNYNEFKRFSELAKALPVGAGDPNYVMNDHPFPVFVNVYPSATSFSPVVRTWNSLTTTGIEVVYGAVAIDTPFSVILYPGDKIRFDVAVPTTGWSWSIA